MQRVRLRRLLLAAGSLLLSGCINIKAPERITIGGYDSRHDDRQHAHRSRAGDQHAARDDHDSRDRTDDDDDHDRSDD